MNNYKVYIHIFPNSKVYVGITKQKPEYRWRNGKKYGNNKYMKNAIQKYKWENIEHKILYDNLNKEEAEQIEIELIKKYKSDNREFGYNILKGGNVSKGMSEEVRKEMSIKRKGKHYSPRTEFKKGHKPWTTGKKMSEQHRKILSEAHKGQKLSEETKRKLSKNNARYWKGKKRSPETIKKMSEGLKGKASWIKGKHHSLETKKKISASKKGTISVQRKKVLCVETQIIYESLTKTGEKTNISIGHISQCCNKKRKTAGGYHWKYVE